MRNILLGSLLPVPAMAILPIARGVESLRTTIAGAVADSEQQARSENSSLIAAIAGGVLVGTAFLIYHGVKK